MVVLVVILDYAGISPTHEGIAMTSPAEHDQFDELAVKALYGRTLEQVAAEDAEMEELQLRHRLYDPVVVENFYKGIDTRESDARRRLRKTLEPMLGEQQAWRQLARVPGNPDWDRELRRDFPHFAPVLDHLQAEFALAALGDGALSSAPLLLLGEPGIGKSYFLRCLAEILATSYEEIHFETATAGWILAGSDLAWAGGRQGRVFDLLVNGEVANPLVLLEEVDKVGGDRKYNPLGALYALLEPHSASRFQDEGVSIPLDASRILWMATANEGDRIPAPLLSRFNVFQVEAPTNDQAITIAHSVYRKLRETEPWGSHFDSELPDVVAEKIAVLPARGMRKALWLACGRAAHRKIWRLVPEDVAIESAPERLRVGFC
jgi:ATP-dependent Lon protease